MRTCDVVVIGAGPAGLSAAAQLAQLPERLRVLLVDGGPPARDRDRTDDVLAGVGGAGLFSDGKHSWFPSATALWALPDRAALARAYAATQELLGIAHGPLPDPAPVPRTEGWRAKPYPSQYIGFAERLAIIDRLWRAAPARETGVTIVDARRDGDRIVVTTDRGEAIATTHVIVATGRLSPMWLRPALANLGVRYAFQRVEFGVRVELPADHALFARLPGTDGKLVMDVDAATQLRTFCTCRDGEVVRGRMHDIVAYSGRADCPKTGRSNVGLVVRTRDPDLGREVLAAMTAGRGFGARGEALIAMALARLGEFEPIDGAVIHAPCLEGVGDYPIVDGRLAAAPGVWIAGDACGLFRGIVASMIAGRYVALQIAP